MNTCHFISTKHSIPFCYFVSSYRYDSYAFLSNYVMTMLFLTPSPYCICGANTWEVVDPGDSTKHDEVFHTSLPMVDHYHAP